MPDTREVRLTSSSENGSNPIERHDYPNNTDSSTQSHQHEHSSSTTLLQNVITNISREINEDSSLHENHSCDTNTNHIIESSQSTCDSIQVHADCNPSEQFEVDRFNASMTRIMSEHSPSPGMGNKHLFQRYSDHGLYVPDNIDAPPRIAEFCPIDMPIPELSQAKDQMLNSQISNVDPRFHQSDDHQNFDFEEVNANSDEKQYVDLISKTSNSITNPPADSPAITQPANYQESNRQLTRMRKRKSSARLGDIQSIPNGLAHSSNSSVRIAANSDARSTRKRVRFQLRTEHADDSSLHRRKKRKISTESTHSNNIEHRMHSRKKSLMHNRTKCRREHFNDGANKKKTNIYHDVDFVTPGGDTQPSTMEYSSENARYFNKARMKEFYLNLCNSPTELQYQPTESVKRWRERQYKFSLSQCWGYVVKVDSIRQITAPTGLGVGPILNNVVGLLFFEVDPDWKDCLILTVIAERQYYIIVAEELKLIIPKIRREQTQQQSKRPIINAYIGAKDKELKRMLKRVGFEKTKTRKTMKLKAKDVGPVGARKCMIPNEHGIVTMLMKGYVLRE